MCENGGIFIKGNSIDYAELLSVGCYHKSVCVCVWSSVQVWICDLCLSAWLYVFDCSNYQIELYDIITPTFKLIVCKNFNLTFRIFKYFKKISSKDNVVCGLWTDCTVFFIEKAKQIYCFEKNVNNSTALLCIFI